MPIDEHPDLVGLFDCIAAVYGQGRSNWRPDRSCRGNSVDRRRSRAATTGDRSAWASPAPGAVHTATGCARRDSDNGDPAGSGSAIIGNQMQAVVLVTEIPADPAVPGRALQGRSGKAQQGQPLAAPGGDIPQGMTDLRQRPQVVMGLHHRLKARLFGGRCRLQNDLVKIQAPDSRPLAARGFIPSYGGIVQNEG